MVIENIEAKAFCYKPTTVIDLISDKDDNKILELADECALCCPSYPFLNPPIFNGNAGILRRANRPKIPARISLVGRLPSGT